MWGHELWNAGRFLATGIDSGELDVRGCACLELGAGAGLPSLVAALAGAAAVVASDYGTPGDDALVAALRQNAAALAAQRAQAAQAQAAAAAPGAVAAAAAAPWCDVAVEPHVWGTDCAPLLAHLAHLQAPAPGAAPASPDPAPAPRRFDRILLADLLFNRSAHAQLLQTLSVRQRRGQRSMTFVLRRACMLTVRCRRPAQACLAPGGAVWVAYSHHDPRKAPLDDAFFDRAAAPPFAFACRKARLGASDTPSLALVQPRQPRSGVRRATAMPPRRCARCGTSGTCSWRGMGWTTHAQLSTSTSSRGRLSRRR